MPDSDRNESYTLPRIALAAALAATLLSLGLFLRTLHPGVGPSLDSIELQIAALVGGVIHPPGSPQYLMLGRLAMTVLPGPDPAFRLNLFSALCAALAVGLTYLSTYRLTRSLVVSLFAGLSLALAVRFWYQASIAELYALNALYVAAVFYWLISWYQTRRPGFFWAATVCYAFSFGNHLTMILLLPAYLFMVSTVDRNMLLRPRHLLITSAIVFAAALQYLYIPLRAGAPFCNFCPTPTHGLLAYLRGPLLDYITGGPFKAAVLSLSPSETLARLPESIGLWNRQFLPWGYVLGIIGAWELFKRRADLAWFAAIAIVPEYLFVITYDIPDWHDFLTPVYVLFAPLIGYGTFRIWQVLEPQIDDLLIKGRDLTARLYMLGLVGMLVAASSVAAYANLPQVDQSQNDAYIVNSRALLSQAGPNALLLMPRPSSPSFIYSWAVRYTAFATPLAPGLQAISPPEVDPPPGPTPYYLRWVDVANRFTPEALIADRPEVYTVDWADDRLLNMGLLPICSAEGDLAGYRLVSVFYEGEQPLVDAAEWERIRNYVYYGEGEARCPG